MKVDLNFEIFDLEGKVINSANKIIAGLLMSETKGDAEKLFDWGIKLFVNEVIEIDNSDFEKFKTLVKSSERIAVIAKAPILKYLQSLK
jgi:hypothetical protein